MFGRLRRTTVALSIGLAAGALPASSQWTASVRVKEAAGIRRNAFPARISMEVPQGRLQHVSQLSLTSSGVSEVASQGTSWSTWPDGSIRALDVDFNLSIGPLEERVLELRYGPDVAGTIPAGTSFMAMEEERVIVVGRVRLNRVGSPLLASVAYREELIGTGRSGIAVVERTGILRDAREITWEPVQILKNGPITVLLRYRGRLGLSAGSIADITLDVEMPNSKSWLKISASVSDPDRRVGLLSVEAPLGMGAYPWTWDFATPNASYGSFRDPTGSAIFTRTIQEGGAGGWQILAGSAGAEQPYEQSAPGAMTDPRTWAHFIGPAEAVAFAVETSPGVAGEIRMWFTGTGQTSVGFRSAEPEAEHAITVYQHYVGTPVPIGAATSPASILSPLVVTVE